MQVRVGLLAALLVAVQTGFAGIGPAVSDSAADQKAVVRVGETVITAEEFQERLNLTPWAVGMPGGDKEKKEMLAASVAAEKIMAAEARRQRLDTLGDFRIIAAETEKEAVYEEWMDQNITRRASWTPDEAHSAFRRFQQQRVVRYAVFDDSLAAVRARQALPHGKGLRELHTAGGRDVAVQEKTLRYAEALPAVEDLVYGLKQGEVSLPLRVDGRYYLFELTQVTPDPVHGGGSFNYWRLGVEKRVKARKAAQLFDRVVPGLLRNKSFTINRSLYTYLADELAKRLPLHDPDRLRSPETLNGDLAVLPPSIEERFGEPLARFADGKVWTIGEVWRNLRYGPYLLNFRSEKEVKAGLEDLLRQMVIFETVAEQGYQQGLQRSAYVQKETAMWDDNMLARLYMAGLKDTVQVDEASVKAWYEKNLKRYMKPELRRIQEIVVADHRLGEKLVDSIRAGADMTSLLRRHGLSFGEGVRYPEGFWIAPHTYGDAGKEAFMLTVGGIAGPMPIDSSHYSLVKLLEIKPGTPAPLDEVRGAVRRDLLQARTYQTVQELLEKLAGNYSIRVDETALSGIEVMEGATITYKTHFPNRPAMPGTLPIDPRSSWFVRAVGTTQQGAQ